MKNKLSARKFVQNNKKQVGVLMIALSLSFMTMYLIHFLFMASEVSLRDLCLEQPKKVAYLDISDQSLGFRLEDYASREAYDEAVRQGREAFIEQIRKCPGIEDAYETQVLMASYYGIAGGSAYYFPITEPERIESYLAHMGARLTEGRMPRGDGEVIADERILKNHDSGIGDYFMEDSYGECFQIVGTLESENLTVIGTPQGYTNAGWYITVLCREETADMTRLLEGLGVEVSEWDEIEDIQYWKDTYEKDVVATLKGVVTGILIVITVFLTIAIVVAYVSFMRTRVNEYCLYASIGYSRKDVYSMMMRELFLVFGISMVIGVVLTVLAMVLMGEYLLAPLGLTYQYFYPEQIHAIVAVFAIIVGVLQMPVWVTLYKIKTIDRIEE